jgi:multimeric flavodoxin WrbA
MEKPSDMKTILVIYHSQGGTMASMAEAFAMGAAKMKGVRVVLKKAQEAGLDDLLSCHGLAICSPEYFGYMAGAIKDFFDRTYEGARDRTFRLPYALLVCAGNDGRGAVNNIERIAAGYKWKKVLEPVRVVGKPDKVILDKIQEMGQTLAAGVEAGIY